MKNKQVKTYLFIILLVFLSNFDCKAQCQQHCIVMEYNEAEQKSPLAGVEVLVRNAGSTVSDTNGNVTLRFRTQKTGDRVIVRRIEKSGFEIFNKDAIEQWNITNKGIFKIVMCRSDRFKRIRDNYLAISSNSYAKQRKAEEAKLQAMKRKGKMKQAEYEKEMIRIEEEYEQKLSNIDVYIDRFARIDLNEISKEEAKAIKMFQDGDIDGAIKVYEDLKLEEKYKLYVENKKKKKRAADSLTVIKMQHEEMCDSISSFINRRDSIKRHHKKQ